MEFARNLCAHRFHRHVGSIHDIRATLGRAAVDARTGLVWHGDALELLARLPGQSVDLVLTSPPYNIGKEYESPLPVSEYLEWCSSWLAELVRVVTPTGAIWLNLGSTPVPGRGASVPLPYLLWPHVSGLHLVQEIVWHQTNGVACRRRFSPRNEKLLWLVKNPSRYTFNLDDVRDPDVAYPNQRRGGRLRCNPLGKNPADVWTVNRVTAGRATSERTAHPAQMPVALAERVIRACSNAGDIVLDPLAGAGTTVVTARRLGRTGLGFEIRDDYVDICALRLREKP